MKRFILCLCVFVVVLGSSVSDIFAQTSGGSSKDQSVKAEEVKPSGYPVVLGDRTLFSIQDIEGYSGKERAGTLSARLKAIAEDFGVPIDSITVSDYKQPLTLVYAGDNLLLAVLNEDAAAVGKTRQEFAKEFTETVRTAIAKYRHDYSRKAILMGILYAFMATLVLVALLYLVVRAHRWVNVKVRDSILSRKVSIHIQTLELIGTEVLVSALGAGTKIIRFVLFLAVFYFYIQLCLSFFPWTEAFAGRLFAYIIDPLERTGLAILVQTPNLITLGVITLITYYVLRVMGLLFKGIETGTIAFKGFYPEWAQPTYRICRILVIAFAVVIAFPYIPGSESPAFKGISIFLGVLFSLGSTSAVANMLAGYTLTYRRAFKIGDRVKIADFVGDVVETGIQVVNLRTIKNEEIVVPSSMIVNSHVINYSSLAKERGLILHTKVTIGYDTPWRQVEALLLLGAERTQGLLREPAPFILQTSLDDFYVSYELNVYTDQPKAMGRIYTDLHRNIQDAFNEYGVQIMSPSYRGDPVQPKVVPKDQWYAPPAHRSADKSE